MVTLCDPGPEADLVAIGRARMLADRDGEQALRQSLAQLYTSRELSPVTLVSGDGSRFDRLRGVCTEDSPRLPPDPEQPVISVIMPVFNAKATLGQALDSVLRQDWAALEVLVVDDRSTDGGLAIARAVAEQDGRVRVIEAGSNMGTYSARNLGLAHAKGAFITVHDADDWSHPSKLRLQATALLSRPELKASVSHWVRSDNDLAMTRWRIEPEGWVHRNVSSLMIRSELRSQLGYWDRVRVNADTEYYFRILAAFGAAAIAEVCPGVPLAWGRSLESSLTGRSETYARTHLWGVRNDYMEAARFWQDQATRPEDLYLPQQPQERPFNVPQALGPADPPGPPSAYDKVLESGWFDTGWYLSAYPNVARAHLGAVRHYLMWGMSEDRDPGPKFSASGYRIQKNLPAVKAALMDWVDKNGAGRTDQMADLVCPEFSGALARQSGPRVLVCAHAAGRQLFGAERSFLDILQRLKGQGKVPVVVVPALLNRDYFNELCRLSAAVVAVPQAWRRFDRPPDPRTVEILRDLIRRYSVTAVHVNTLVPDAPLAAARAETCMSVVHVRELPEQDPALCRQIGASPDELRNDLLNKADRFVANSPLVAEWLNSPARTEVVFNKVERELFSLKFSPGPVLRAGLVSSNIAKKGLRDAVQVARLLEAAQAPVEILLIGPETEDLKALRPLGANVSTPGYAETPKQALSQVDVVLSLSHFTESFGRTVLEAMAAGRPVVCYDRGMPAWLVRGGIRGGRLTAGGVVVPADDAQTVADTLVSLARRRSRLFLMSYMARLRAWLINGS